MKTIAEENDRFRVDWRRASGARLPSRCATQAKMVVFVKMIIMIMLGSPAHAQQMTMVSQTGDCHTYQIAEKREFCSGMLYVMFHETGRGAFNFATERGALMLSGGRDSQLTPERYVLEIDTIRVTEDGMTRNYDATGRCTMMTAFDGSVVYTLQCTASTGLETIEIVFHGDGSPVSISAN